MLKEHLVSLVVKAYSRASDAKVRIRDTINNEFVYNYVRALRNVALDIVERQWPTALSLRPTNYAKKADTKGVAKTTRSRKIKKAQSQADVLLEKKARKSSIRPAKEIGSERADIILERLKSENARMISASDVLLGKKTLACLVWALGHAERAHLNGGISVHDVSALLYRACQIELYPINISRVVHGNKALIRQVGQERRTKTYLLTKEGQALFDAKNF